MPLLAALAHLADPQPVAQAGAPFGQVHGDDLPAGEAHRGGGELLRRPVLAGEFVVGQAGDVLGLHPQEEGRANSLRGRTPA